MNDSTTTADELGANLKQLVSDADELLAATAGSTDSKVADLRKRIGETLKGARSRLHDAQESAVARAKAAGQATDKYVHEHPWQSVGVAAAAGAVVGLLVGLLASRR
jgi:ElaB/YqjD/DUF883 family membrane-anchored ribosome-binding protein